MSCQSDDLFIDDFDESESGSRVFAEYKNLQVEEVLALLDAAQTVAISGHVNPDGDALGSALALRDLLRALGKKADVLLGQESRAPELYEFLPDYDFVYSSEYTATPDLFIAVDAATSKRLGRAEELIEVAKVTLTIDHHASFQGFTQYYYGDDTVPATASLIWRIIKASRIQPTLNMAMYCFVGIMTDTGRFAFINTDRTAFTDAAEMIDIGVNTSEISQHIYENKSLDVMRLEALIIDRIQFSCAGKVVYSYILQSDLSMLGLKRDDTEQLPTVLRSIKGVEIAVLFRDEEGEGVRVNLRSRDTFNVGVFASKHGGGGHHGAAGLTLTMTLAEAISHTLSLLLDEIPVC